MGAAGFATEKPDRHLLAFSKDCLCVEAFVPEQFSITRKHRVFKIQNGSLWLSSPVCNDFSEYPCIRKHAAAYHYSWYAGRTDAVIIILRGFYIAIPDNGYGQPLPYPADQFPISQSLEPLFFCPAVHSEQIRPGLLDNISDFEAVDCILAPSQPDFHRHRDKYRRLDSCYYLSNLFGLFQELGTAAFFNNPRRRTPAIDINDIRPMLLRHARAYCHS